MALNASDNEFDDVIYLVPVGLRYRLLDKLKDLIIFLRKLKSQIELKLDQSSVQGNELPLNQLVDYQLIQNYFILKPTLLKLSDVPLSSPWENSLELSTNHYDFGKNIRCKPTAMLKFYYSKFEKLKNIIIFIPMPNHMFLLLFIYSKIYIQKLRHEIYNSNLIFELAQNKQSKKAPKLSHLIFAVILILDNQHYIIYDFNSHKLSDISIINIINDFLNSIKLTNFIERILSKFVKEKNYISSLKLKINPDYAMYFIMELKGDLINLNYNKYFTNDIKLIQSFEQAIDRINPFNPKNIKFNNKINLKRKAENENSCVFANVAGKRARKANTNHLTKSNCEEEIMDNFDHLDTTVYGPLPKSKLFKSYAFIVTSGVAQSIRKFHERSIPFIKSYLIKQIIAGKGCIFNSTSQVEVYCIIRSHSRSVKYISCLAYGIPVISYQWIIDCCIANELLPVDPYRIPDDIYINNYLSINLIKDRSEVFRNVKFFFGSQYPLQLYDFWAEPLIASNAILYPQNRHQYSISILDTERVDIIIADSTCPEEIIKKAKLMKIPLVSSEYIVQCIFTGTKLPLDLFPQFAYDYEKISI